MLGGSCEVLEKGKGVIQKTRPLFREGVLGDHFENSPYFSW